MKLAKKNLNKINEKSLERIKEFRDKNGSFEEFSRLKHEFPFHGFVECMAGNIDFLMFSANDDVVAWEYLWFGPDYYENEIVKTWLEWCESPGIIYDIGSYTGLMSILAAKCNKNNIIHLFEPMDRTIERAKINLKLNLIDKQVYLNNKACSNINKEEKIFLYRNENFLGTGNSIYDKDLHIHDTKIINCIKLDEYKTTEKPHIIKIDVEGHELECLLGLKETILSNKPKMIVEIWEHNREKILEILNSWGYDCEAFEKKNIRVMNFKCLPK